MNCIRAVVVAGNGGDGCNSCLPAASEYTSLPILIPHTNRACFPCTRQIHALFVSDLVIAGVSNNIDSEILVTLVEAELELRRTATCCRIWFVQATVLEVAVLARRALKPNAFGGCRYNLRPAAAVQVGCSDGQILFRSCNRQAVSSIFTRDPRERKRCDALSCTVRIQDGLGRSAYRPRLGNLDIGSIDLERVALPISTRGELKREVGAVRTNILLLNVQSARGEPRRTVGSALDAIRVCTATFVQIFIVTLIKHARVKDHGFIRDKLDRNPNSIGIPGNAGGVCISIRFNQFPINRYFGGITTSSRHVETEVGALRCTFSRVNGVTLDIGCAARFDTHRDGVAIGHVVEINGFTLGKANPIGGILNERVERLAVLRFDILNFSATICVIDSGVCEIVASQIRYGFRCRCGFRIDITGNKAVRNGVDDLVVGIVKTQLDIDGRACLEHPHGSHQRLRRFCLVDGLIGRLLDGGILSNNLNRLDLHRQLVGHLIRGDLVLAVGVGGQLGLDAVDDRLDLIDLPAVGGLGGELQFFVCGNVDRVGVVVNLVPVLGKGDGGAVSQIQLDGSKLVLLDRRRRRRLGLGAQNRVGRGVRGGGFGCRLGRRLDGLDHGLFGCLRAVGRRGLIRRSRRLIGHGGVCRLRSGGLHAGIIHRRGNILACLLVGHRGGCKRRRAHHLRGKQNRQDDGRCLDAEIPPSSQDSTVGLHKTPPTFSAAISRGSSSPDRAAPCVPTWEPNFHSGIPARDVHSSAIRRRTPTRRVKIIASIFTTNTHPGFSAKNELGRQRNECIPDRCYFLTFRNERGVSGHQCGNRAAAPRNECRQ